MAKRTNNVVNVIESKGQSTVAVNEAYQKWVNVQHGIQYYRQTAAQMVRDEVAGIEWNDGAEYTDPHRMMIGLGILAAKREGDDAAKKKAINNELSAYRVNLANVAPKGYTLTFKQKSKTCPRPHLLVKAAGSKKKENAATFWKRGVSIYGIDDMVAAVRNDKDALKALAELIKKA